MITQKDLDDFDKEEETEAPYLRKGKGGNSNFVKIGFSIALSILIIEVVWSLVYKCLNSLRVPWFSQFFNVYFHIVLVIKILGLASMIVNIVAYVKSPSNDVKAQKYSAVGITIGAIMAWPLFTELITAIFS